MKLNINIEIDINNVDKIPCQNHFGDIIKGEYWDNKQIEDHFISFLKYEIKRLLKDEEFQEQYVSETGFEGCEHFNDLVKTFKMKFKVGDKVIINHEDL